MARDPARTIRSSPIKRKWHEIPTADLCGDGGICEHVAVPKQLIRGVIKLVAGIAAIVFILARMTTNTGLILFVGSIVVLLVCFGLLKLLEGDDENTGYWPDDRKQ